MADFTNFYEYFHKSFLATANSLPINSMWLVDIQSIPNTSEIIKSKENWDLKRTTDATKSNIMSHQRNSKGIIIAQGVKIVGDEMGVSREGTKNTGLIQGVIGTGRTGFPSLNISFAENNVSFTDYVLRPWMVSVAHNSLKEASLKTNIIVTLFSRTGIGKDIATRKSVIYHNCCPISIDEMEHNYSGSDMLKLRSIQFTYTHYEIIGAQDALLNLIGENGDELATLHAQDSMEGKEPKSAGKSGSDPKVTSATPYVESNTILTNGLTDSIDNKHVQKSAGTSGTSPTVSPDKPYVDANIGTATSALETYINNVTRKAKDFGVDMVKGTLKSIFTNTVGAVEDTVINAVNEVKGDIRGLATDAINTIDNAVNNALGNVDRIKAGGSTNTNVSNKQDDTPIHKLPEQDVTPLIKTKINTGLEINQNDNVTGLTPIPYTIVKTSTNDHVTHFAPTPDDKYANTNDHRTGLQIMNDDKHANTNDHITGITTLKNTVLTNQNDHIIGAQVNTNIIPINQADRITSKNISYVFRTTNQNDALRQ
jgi:hypothetical protein